MKHSDFQIGKTFSWCGDGEWRCTDIGTRAILAIRIDRVEIESSTGDPSQPHTFSTLTQVEAEAEGLFSGPPYMIAEVVFDEYDLPGCSIERESEDSEPPEPTDEERKLMEAERAATISGPYMESRKVLSVWSTTRRAARANALEEAGELEAAALLREKARPQDLMAVVKCGLGHLMRAQDYDVHRSICGRWDVLPVTHDDVVELEKIEADAVDRLNPEAPSADEPNGQRQNH